MFSYVTDFISGKFTQLNSHSAVTENNAPSKILCGLKGRSEAEFWTLSVRAVRGQSINTVCEWPRRVQD